MQGRKGASLIMTLAVILIWFTNFHVAATGSIDAKPATYVPIYAIAPVTSDASCRVSVRLPEDAAGISSIFPRLLSHRSWKTRRAVKAERRMKP
jgi:hypothetical protein